ncbi:RNA polymerase sigma-70 factor (sigma-E family) [Motilibacter peucedani]|uniref:RNA polymerase sigma-70 factor (Sigma-E family) n=1 Tax=Motilibacter peucedani TaxID=598650 RepID=A0A420XKA6_9ACTN|nr:SigE family RNA polymerase sigma factor [Motilibacter peucedani]RKS68574.1 RNA polymerase sigma-70 factor (sigma-E family) [Motilibacter peucedani]
MSEPQQLPAFDEYVVARSAALLRFAFVLTGDAHLAEDLLQGALLKAHRNWQRVAATDHPDAYVRRIVVNDHLSDSRRRRVLESLTAVLPDRLAAGAGGDPAAQVGERDELSRALETLPGKQRAVLVLRHYAGYDDEAIAETLGCSVGAVRVNASRGAARMRALLRPRDAFPATTGDER